MAKNTEVDKNIYQISISSKDSEADESSESVKSQYNGSDVDPEIR